MSCSEGRNSKKSQVSEQIKFGKNRKRKREGKEKLYIFFKK